MPESQRDEFTEIDKGKIFHQAAGWTNASPNVRTGSELLFMKTHVEIVVNTI